MPNTKHTSVSEKDSVTRRWRESSNRERVKISARQYSTTARRESARGPNQRANRAGNLILQNWACEMEKQNNASNDYSAPRKLIKTRILLLKTPYVWYDIREILGYHNTENRSNKLLVCKLRLGQAKLYCTCRNEIAVGAIVHCPSDRRICCTTVWLSSDRSKDNG